jgi:hypothetical protein
MQRLRRSWAERSEKADAASGVLIEVRTRVVAPENAGADIIVGARAVVCRKRSARLARYLEPTWLRAEYIAAGYSKRAKYVPRAPF